MIAMTTPRLPRELAAAHDDGRLTWCRRSYRMTDDRSLIEATTCRWCRQANWQCVEYRDCYQLPVRFAVCPRCGAQEER